MIIQRSLTFDYLDLGEQAANIYLLFEFLSLENIVLRGRKFCNKIFQL